jgi:uncharacterized coiled-coil DUF342 family protein
MKIKRGSAAAEAADKLAEHLEENGATITGIEFDNMAERGTGPMTRREMELLRDLETIDRTIREQESEKKRVGKEYTDRINALTESRDGILSKIEEVRHGQGDLFDPAGGEEVSPDGE